MKNYFLVVFSFFVLIMFCTCTSTNVTKNTIPHIYTNNEHTEIEILGEIIIESKDRVGYIELLRAARSLYPECHFIIDIMVDQIITTTNKHIRSLFRSSHSSETSIVWIMRGTAVKYKNIGSFASLESASSTRNTSPPRNIVNTSTSSVDTRASTVTENVERFSVVNVTGQVLRLTSGERWVDVKNGDILNGNTQIRINSNSTLVVLDGTNRVTIHGGTIGRIDSLVIINR